MHVALKGTNGDAAGDCCIECDEYKRVRQFLLYCGREGYAAAGDEVQKKEADGSTTIELVRGDFRFHDNYFGGEPYGGREVVFYQDKPVWMMVYYGLVLDGGNDVGPLYGFLRKALVAVPDEALYRGPQALADGNLQYTNHWQGEIERFLGEESITRDGQCVYQASYIGGLVDRT